MKVGFVVVLLLSALPLEGCGKVLAGLAKGAVHEADSAAVAAGRAARYEEARIAASAAAHGADDNLHGPAAAAADESAHGETPVADFAADVGKEVITNGLQGSFSNDDDDRGH